MECCRSVCSVSFACSRRRPRTTNMLNSNVAATMHATDICNSSRVRIPEVCLSEGKGERDLMEQTYTLRHALCAGIAALPHPAPTSVAASEVCCPRYVLSGKSYN